MADKIFPATAKIIAFNSEAAAVWICGTAGVGGISVAEGVVDRVRRERRAVATVRVTGRIRIIQIRAQIAAMVSLLIIQPRSICTAVVPMFEYKTRPSSLLLAAFLSPLTRCAENDSL